MFSKFLSPAAGIRVALLGFSALALLSCDPEETQPEPVQLTNNVFIVNEGNFNTPNGAVSIFNTASKKVTDVDAFKTANARPLGDNVQSMAVVDTVGYVVVTQSNKIEVVRLPELKSAKRAVKTISGLKKPRYFAALSNQKAYVTEWVDYGVNGRLSVIDLTTNTVTKSIALRGEAPEQLVIAGGKVFVANSGSNTVSVINTATDTEETLLTVGDAPNSLTVDQNGRVWVLCGGFAGYTPNYEIDPATSTKGTLYSFLPASPTTVQRLEFASTVGFPGHLQIDGSKSQLYFIYSKGVYRMSINDKALPTTPLIRRSFYGLGIDPKDNTVYGSVAPYTTAGRFIRFQSTGAAIDSFTVGMFPNGFIFY
ncbi:hypothetical protein E5K00_16545 [Hymenobacter aquaticus]|uniref:YncE family protein n=1 Tax=Hymenobacter aquaticus TaxID=1867101 RepID=A0A4Z0PZI1_9BACT|nr:DUF5074 domain-containing protein [Hymenobacter aquaticus]TGE21872.1 hypothetical protein E5K00_16545 [Hymenobacter aquaticus]